LEGGGRWLAMPLVGGGLVKKKKILCSSVLAPEVFLRLPYDWFVGAWLGEDLSPASCRISVCDWLIEKSWLGDLVQLR
jgi:hypothetical protein